MKVHPLKVDHASCEIGVRLKNHRTGTAPSVCIDRNDALFHNHPPDKANTIVRPSWLNLGWRSLWQATVEPGASPATKPAKSRTARTIKRLSKRLAIVSATGRGPILLEFYILPIIVGIYFVFGRST